ncbi:hypothetical protein [uncultured Campylobacter sp.]|uniref:hypothetical protein n=1 Tax=uncultured Campylobacter sp. TaxID=218934 RepID=UPI00260BF99A|nr:hypothetical protein [uncultured Campylobacter sp.]
MKNFILEKIKRQKEIFEKTALQKELYNKSDLILKNTREDILSLKQKILKEANATFKKEAQSLIKKAIKDMQKLAKQDEQRYEIFKKYEKDFLKQLNTNLI